MRSVSKWWTLDKLLFQPYIEDLWDFQVKILKSSIFCGIVFHFFGLSGGRYGIKQDTHGNKVVEKIMAKSYLCIDILYPVSILRDMQILGILPYG